MKLRKIRKVSAKQYQKLIMKLGSKLEPTDGFHRRYAAKQLGIKLQN